MGPGSDGGRTRRSTASPRAHALAGVIEGVTLRASTSQLRCVLRRFAMAVVAALRRPGETSASITRDSRPHSDGMRPLNGDHAKRRSARQRTPVDAESEPLELRSHASDRPSAVRPALALTAAEEVETIRRVLLEAATNTTRESWATCSCPECGKSFRQEISVPDHGARIKAVETLLREGLGRVGEAEVPEPRMPSTLAELEALSWSEMNSCSR